LVVDSVDDCRLGGLHMLRFALSVFACLIFVQPAFAAQTVSGAQALRAIGAGACEKNNFARFASWATTSGFTSETLKVRDVEVNGAIIHAKKSSIKLQRENNGRWIAIVGDRKISGQDICDLVVNYAESEKAEKKSASLFSFLIPEAFAEAIVMGPAVQQLVLNGVVSCTVGMCGQNAPIYSVTAAEAAAAPRSIGEAMNNAAGAANTGGITTATVSNSETQKIPEAPVMRAIITAPTIVDIVTQLSQPPAVAVTCSNKKMTINNNGTSISVESGNKRKNQDIVIARSMSKPESHRPDSANGPYQNFPQGDQLRSLAKTCHNAEDAKRIQDQLKAGHQQSETTIAKAESNANAQATVAADNQPSNDTRAPASLPEAPQSHNSDRAQ
jgi:hypothetical protein